jgi:transcriptional regulator with XRE-family HTH domain
VTAADDIAEFLASRRAMITPEQAGLPSFGQRRVPGLRREEVASLAGVSADYYRRLERGQVSGVSELVLAAVAGALQLDEAERAQLFDLARATGRPAGATRNARPAPRGQRARLSGDRSRARQAYVTRARDGRGACFARASESRRDR